ncbi:cytidylate kinase [Aeromicrobium panaciterrae]|uniref:Cytidylate kinase n=1 Tax=Aeromicrobium panaciterrae TaxID=363861 RepID=A0ABU1UNQ8_9ACTN|nr:(d)CMP kinase [Aeromicrobium panaciterrae]MDR7086817.1 cytidylate kinase [Aeromicrobium panaciterrae]
MSTSLVVAVDGPSGSGKSSTARGVADRLGLAYLDTGAMYRAMTWALLRAGTDLSDPDAIAAAARGIHLESGVDPLDPTIYADGVDVAEAIRGENVTAAVSYVAAVPSVREQLVAMQRQSIADNGDRIVVEGRDIGSTVAPDADFKIYLVADPAARAARRAAEDGSADALATEQALAKRDEIDSNRAASPLAMADDAVLVDSTYMTLEEVIATIVDMVEQP